MAAYRAGIKTVLIPYDNLPDLDEVDPKVKENVSFVPAKNVETPSPLKKLTVIVLPGTELTLARFLRLKTLFMSEDFPTFERPENANSSRSDFGICLKLP